MRIASILIENFRAIRFVQLDNLADAVVIAGPNGCGKSSIFDAIRLLKSAYGQYHQNEYRSWFSEFQIDINRIRQDAQRVLHDPSQPLRVRAEFQLSDDEREYLRENGRDLYRHLNWAEFRGMRSSESGPFVVNPATQRAQGPIIESQTIELMKSLTEVIDDKTHVAELIMAPDSDPIAMPSPVVELMFSVFRPSQLGVVEYHGPNRNYVREQIGGINLKIQDPSQANGQHALYNTQMKYHGVKTQMAQLYVRQLLAEAAGVKIPEAADLKKTLDELFGIFFPGKTFLGALPTSDGGLAFPVRLENGQEHDIDELSSGEKEVLLGYLRLRNSALHNSIILLDEPELHLNPRLVRGLPRFYQKHLGAALGNQLWLITHSDALLREAIEEPAYAVYHMHPSYTTGSSANQVDRVSASAEVETAIIHLVGDLATYSPRSKVVLLEGENSEVDANLIRELFPEFVERVNLISAGSKHRVGSLHDILESASTGGRLDARFYSIVDRDYDGLQVVDSTRRFAWDVYHVENYFLEPRFIREAMRSLQLGGVLPTEGEILESLRTCAETTVDELVRIRMDQRINKELVQCVSTRFAPGRPVAAGFREAAVRSLERMRKAVEDKFSEADLAVEEAALRDELQAALRDGRWKSEFKGRDILNLFTAKHKKELGVAYERLRNLIINRMREAGFRPAGMASVIEAITGS